MLCIKYKNSVKIYLKSKVSDVFIEPKKTEPARLFGQPSSAQLRADSFILARLWNQTPTIGERHGSLVLRIKIDQTPKKSNC